MCIVCQTVSVGAAALTGILPVATPEPEATRPMAPAASLSAVHSTSIGGSACKRIGQIRSTSAGLFRCAATANRRTWRLVSTTTTSTTIPVTTATTTTTTTAPTPRSVVHNDILRRATLARTQPSKAGFEFRIAPSINATRAQQLREAILWAFIPWESQTTGAGPRVIVLDENGEDFWRANMPVNGNCPGAPGAPRYVPPSRGSLSGFGCWNQEGDHVLYMAIGSDVREWPSNFLHHEVAHLAQAAIYGSRPRDTDQPCFLGEGEATLYGNVLGDGLTGGEIGHQRGRAIAGDIAIKYSLRTDSDWLAFLKTREVRDQTCGLENFNYFIGYLYMERLYLDFGVEKIAAWKSQLPGRDWRDPFQQVFGTSPSHWYSTSLIPYIRESCGC